MTGRRYRIGLIGAGRFGREHAEALAGLPDRIEFAAVADPNPEARNSVAERFGARRFAEWRALLPEVDAVVVATSHDAHAEIATAALEAGRGVMIEKPLAVRLAECDSIVAAARRSGSPCMVAQPSRFIPGFAEMLRRVRDGAIGRVAYARSAMIKDFEIGTRQAWHLDPRQGGMWLVNAVHLVDRLTLIFGEPPIQVSAAMGAWFHADLPVDDSGIAIFRFPESRIGVAEAVGFRHGSNDHTTFVQGTEGALRWSPDRGTEFAHGGRWTTATAPDPQWLPRAMRGEWLAFLDHLDGGPSPVSAVEGRQAVAAVLAATTAAETGQSVAIA
jgi:predicted dehydrogenase